MIIQIEPCDIDQGGQIFHFLSKILKNLNLKTKNWSNEQKKSKFLSLGKNKISLGFEPCASA